MRDPDDMVRDAKEKCWKANTVENKMMVAKRNLDKTYLTISLLVLITTFMVSRSHCCLC
jgi:hypothetical protein